eukprot:CAMPEP_0180737670 /NCGR_PEP_ID=MMETSP1038_2-20121128/24407_1 /TAXON_ID=632150 /ORGANISM="Azadinium spinosum, Strain 3D9" /LENGTH=342 /DNA_ID=CAMNT_0022770773 /DNA_START=3 /DNA_END=1031 /DNA_ORIENTATION=+
MAPHSHGRAQATCSGPGFLAVVLAAALLLSASWLFMASPIEGGALPSQIGFAGGGAERAVLQLALDRYETLARNMTTRIRTAELALHELQHRAALPPPPRLRSQSAASGAAAASGDQRGGSSTAVHEGSPEDGDANSKEDGATEAEPAGDAESGDDEGPGESDEEREKRQQEEEKAQLELIKYDSVTKTYLRFRPDFKCGNQVPLLPDAEVVECEPGGEAPCCSGLGWCGKSKLHCKCDLCSDYRSSVEVKLTGVHSFAKARECENIAADMGEQTSPQACAKLAISNVDCGWKIMFSKTYPQWGCRCCGASTGAGDEEKPEWEVFALEVAVTPVAATAGVAA